MSNTPALHGDDATAVFFSDDGTSLLPRLRECGFSLRCAEPKYFRRSVTTSSPGLNAKKLAYADCTYMLFDRIKPRFSSLSTGLPPTKGERGAVLVLSLPRRRDRRAWIEATCAGPLRELGLEVQILDAYDGAMTEKSSDGLAGMIARQQWRLDEAGLEDLAARWEAAGMLPVQREELALYHGRPISEAEVACLASHRAAWVAARNAALDWVSCQRHST